MLALEERLPKPSHLLTQCIRQGYPSKCLPPSNSKRKHPQCSDVIHNTIPIQSNLENAPPGSTPNPVILPLHSFPEDLVFVLYHELDRLE